MATLRRNRDLRLPGQSFGYKDHPSNVGSASYFADTERGWVPNPGASLNKKVNRGGGWKHPVSPTRRLPSDRQPGIGIANRRAAPSFGYDRAGGATNIGRYSGAPGGIGAGITAIAPGQDVEEESFSFTDEGLGKNFLQDAGRMAGDLTPDVRMPGILGIAGDFGKSLGANREHHKYINSRLGRASPEKNLAFWEQAFGNAFKPSPTSDATTRSFGDTSKGTSFGQAEKYFNQAGLTRNDLDKFMGFTPSKWTGNEAWLRSMSSDKEKFDTGMSFIKNAKASANLARNMAAQEQTQLNQGMSPNDYYERGEHWRDTSGDVAAIGPDYETGEHWNIDDTPFGLTETEDVTADVGGDDYYTEGELWEDTSNDLYGDALYETGEMMPDEQYSLWGDPGFYDKPVGPRGMLGTERTFADMAKRNSGFISPFKNVTNLPFNPNALLPRVSGNTVNPNLIEEEETFIKPKTNLRGRLGLYD